MKVIIAGSRNFNNYTLLKQICDLELTGNVEIVSGRQVTTDKETGEKYGADYLGEKYAEEKNILVTPFPADWSKYGKKAGPIRNEEMAKYADALIAFWDGKSKGTQNMIELAKKYNLLIRIVKF